MSDTNLMRIKDGTLLKYTGKHYNHPGGCISRNRDSE